MKNQRDKWKKRWEELGNNPPKNHPFEELCKLQIKIQEFNSKFGLLALMKKMKKDRK